MTHFTPTELDYIHKALMYYLKELKAHRPVNKPDIENTNSMIIDVMLLKEKAKEIRDREQQWKIFGLEKNKMLDS